MPKTAGYSGTPLAQKLGLAAGMRVAILSEPDGFRQWLEPLPPAIRLQKSLGRTPDVVVVFATRQVTLGRRVASAVDAIYPDGAIWAAWPKKSSSIPSDITEDTVRAIALPLGLVDNKVCAISDAWSGLRIVWRRENRIAGGPPRGADVVTGR